MRVVLDLLWPKTCAVALRIRSEFKKSAVKLVSELSTDRPDRVERLSDKLSLFRRHDANRRYQKSAREAA
jgi:hypothetical protein